MSRHLKIKVQLNVDHSVSQQQLACQGDLFWREIDQPLGALYDSPHLYLYPAIISTHQGRCFAIARAWGKQVSSLTHSQLQSYFSQAHLPTLLTIIVELQVVSAHIDLHCLYFQNNQQTKAFVTRTCPQQNYLSNAKQLIHRLFFHIKPIVQRNEAVKNMRDFEIWLRGSKFQPEAKTMPQLLSLKLQPILKESSYKIGLSQQERAWIMQKTNHSQSQAMQLVYNGASHNFNPAPLLKAAFKRSLLFLLETAEGKRLAFWMAAKPEIAQLPFGQYYCDKGKQSVLLGLQRRSLHLLGDENYSVGLGNEVLLSIGKTDIVLSAFNISNVSCFPCSYGKDQEKGVTRSEDLLGRQFTLRQLQAYTLEAK